MNVGDFNLFWIAYFKKKLLTTVLKKPSDLKRIDPNSRMHFINVGVQSFYERSRFLLKFKEYYLFLV